MPLRLVIFDVDGTLVDSQALIVAALTQAFAAVGAPAPDRATLLSIVGLSLDVALPQLAPDLTTVEHLRMAEAYKESYIAERDRGGAAPLYPGALETLHHLNTLPDTILGIATGKSKRGLDKLIEGYGLERMFVTRQCADFHPSKPHPSMILQAMADAGTDPSRTAMIGDTTFDMDMAASAGVTGIGVTWGYHPEAALASARHIVRTFDAVPTVLDEAWGIIA